MHTSMRRQDRQVTDPVLIRQILDTAKVGRMGMIDMGDQEEGEEPRPYVVPRHYGYVWEGQELILYMHGAKEGRTPDVLSKNDRVFIEIESDTELISGGDVACRYGASYASIMGDGVCRILEDPQEKIRGLNCLMKLQTGREFPITAAMADSVNVYEITVPVISCKMRKK